ncbi:MAG: hypothetical protein ACLFRN_09165, partial [Halothece sp.]
GVVSEDGYGGLKVLSCFLLPMNRGEADGFSSLFQLRLLSNYHSRKGVPSELVNQLATVPVCDETQVPTEQQIQAWETFLELEKQVAQAHQFLVPFVEHNYGQATRNISFKVDPNLATIDSSTQATLDQDDFWNRARQASRETIKLVWEDELNAQSQEGIELGSIETLDAERNLIRVQLNSQTVDQLTAEQYQLPSKCVLVRAFQ